MGGIVAAVIVLILLLILGVSISSFAEALLVIFLIVLFLMTVFFSVCAVIFAVAKATKAEFCGFVEIKGADFAQYRIDGELYTNIYLAENVMRSKIYKSGEQKIRIFHFRKKAFAVDSHTRLTIFTGLILSVLSFAAVFYEYSMLYGI
ncbi:MAG: hypothetical protein LUE12_06945 [Ruminococcus sp.]|nr:hypothetical protein [Ruminococcus sp.]